MTPSDILAQPPAADPSAAPIPAFGRRMAPPSPAPNPGPPGAAAPPPEDILRAVFLQALTGRPAGLPAGATAEGMRQALVLDPAVSARIFDEAKSRAAALAAAAAGRGDIVQPKSRRTRLIAAAAAAIFIAGAGIATAIFLNRTPSADTALFVAAAKSPAAYNKLLARAKAGDSTAEFALAALLDRRFTPNETTVPKNDAQAFEWYTQAALSGFPPGEQSLGYAYLNGHGVEQDPIAAAHWYTLAAQAGLPNAENALGYMYLNGIGVPQDNLHAVAWLTKAALQGQPLAENSLANAYETGTGVTQDYAQAAIWFTRAAQQGEPNALNSLGYLYYNGLGVKRDYKQSAALFAAAARAHNPLAEMNLALSFINGAGVPKSPVTAATWCYRAQADGAQNAGTALALILKELTPQQQAAAKAAAAKAP